jgi:hypothetical protein
VRVHASTGYNRVEGNRRASRNGFSPTVTIRNFSHRGATGDVGEVLDFGGLSSVDRWVAACKGDTQEKVRIVTWDFGLGIGHGAVSRRPPISLDTMVPRTEGYTYDAGVWGLYIVQGPFSDAPCLSK